MRRYSVPLLVLVTLSLRCSRYEEPQDDCVGGRCDIWGADDRHEPYEASSAFPTELFHAAGALVRKRNVEWDGRRDARMLWDFPLSLSRGVCSDENYADQPAPASCSGFFVGGDVFVTAAHCLSTKSKEAAKKSCETCMSFLTMATSNHRKTQSKHFARSTRTRFSNALRCCFGNISGKLQ